jgi:hypothetical protein
MVKEGCGQRRGEGENQGKDVVGRVEGEGGRQ